MTIGYYRGKRIAKTPTIKTKTRKTKSSDDVINQDEVKHNQHQNKIMHDKMDNAYFNTVEKMHQVQGAIIEHVMRTHKKYEGDL